MEGKDIPNEDQKFTKNIRKMTLPENFLKSSRKRLYENPKIISTDSEVKDILNKLKDIDVKKRDGLEKFIAIIKNLKIDQSEHKMRIPMIRQVCSDYDGNTWFFTANEPNVIWIFDCKKFQKYENEKKEIEEKKKLSFESESSYDSTDEDALDQPYNPSIMTNFSELNTKDEMEINRFFSLTKHIPMEKSKKITTNNKKALLE